MICPKCGEDFLVVHTMMAHVLLPTLLTKCLKCHASFITQIAVTDDDFVYYGSREEGDGGCRYLSRNLR